MKFRVCTVFSGPSRAAFLAASLALSVTFSLTLAGVCHAADTLSFEQAFQSGTEPASLHYTASYEDARGHHELEVWRQGEQKLRRRTDASIDLYATADADDVDLVTLDHTRHRRTDISRSSLYQLGHFIDWFGLAHSLNKPTQAYSLQRATGFSVQEAPLATCDWYALQIESRQSLICWSAAYRIPVQIADAAGKLQWRLTEVDTAAIAGNVFTINDKGYVRLDAENELKSD
jgi:hypothetical protein